MEYYDTEEADLKKLSVQNILKYILHNKRNNDDFSMYFYDELSNKKTHKRRNFGSKKYTKLRSVKRKHALL